MSTQNENYKIFGGIGQYITNQYMNVDIVYTNSISSREFTVNNVVWDFSRNSDLSINFITNKLPGNIVIEGDISGNISNLGTNGKDVLLRSDKQVWKTFTDFDKVGLLINKNQSYSDISQSPGATNYSGSQYIYDGGIEINGNLLLGTHHKLKSTDLNYCVLQGISNEIVGDVASDGSGRFNYLEGENNVALNNTTSTHIEGANNIASGNVLYVEGYGNNVNSHYSYAGGGGNTITSSGASAKLNFANGISNEIIGNSSLLCNTGGYNNNITDSTHSYAHGSYCRITGGKNHTIEGSGNYITSSLGTTSSENYLEGVDNRSGANNNNVKSCWIAGEGNFCDTDYGVVFGRFNSETSNIRFGVGDGTDSATRHDALKIENTITLNKDIQIDSNFYISDLSAGWYNNLENGDITFENFFTEIQGEEGAAATRVDIPTYTYLSSDPRPPPAYVSGFGSYDGGSPYEYYYGVPDWSNDADPWYPGYWFSFNGNYTFARKISNNTWYAGVWNDRDKYSCGSGEFPTRSGMTFTASKIGKSIIRTKNLTCTGNITAAAHYDSVTGKKDYYSGFFQGSSAGLTNADKWIIDTTTIDGVGGSNNSVSYSYNISSVNNAPTQLVDISGAGLRIGGKKTIYIETNLDRVVVNDASVCDIVTVMPFDNNGSGTDVYVPAPYYGIGTMYTVQFPPVPSSKISSYGGGSGNWNTGVNLNRAIFDTNGGGFFSGDSKTTTDIGYAIHFVYTAVNDGIIWKTKLYKT